MSKYHVYYRSADGTLNSDTIEAKDRADVYRVFDGQIVVSISLVDEQPEDNTRLILSGGELIEVGGASNPDAEIPF